MKQINNESLPSAKESKEESQNITKGSVPFKVEIHYKCICRIVPTLCLNRLLLNDKLSRK